MFLLVISTLIALPPQGSNTARSELAIHRLVSFVLDAAFSGNRGKATSGEGFEESTPTTGLWSARHRYTLQVDRFALLTDEKLAR